MDRNKIKQQLDTFAKSMLETKGTSDFDTAVSKFRQYVEDNKKDIKEIYKQDGPESEFLVSGYKIVYAEPSCAICYQECMEAKIAGDVIVAHDEAY